jgi:vacuolar-type H+-ATPase subunit D/Vma8
VDEVLRLIRVKLIDVLIEATEVQQNDKERVQGAYWVIWLAFFDVSEIGIYQEQSLCKLNEVHTTNETIFTVSKPTPKVDNAECREAELTNQNTYRHLQ